MALSRGRIATAAVSVVAIGLVSVYAVISGHRSDPFSDCRNAKTVSDGQETGGTFELVDEDGKTVTERDIISGPVLVYFGAASCADDCSADLARNAEATDALEEMGYSVTPVFISAGAGWNGPEALKRFTGQMHPRMVGLTGSEKQVTDAAKALGVYRGAQMAANSQQFSVDHSMLTYLILPRLGFADYFGREENAEQVATKSACFIDAAQRT